VTQRPEATAIECGVEGLSYAELNARANRLARRLQASGVAAESLAALFLERSADLVIAMLATLKAGGGYVPLDPATPGRRLASIIAEARPRVILTRGELAPALPESGAQVICVDREGEAIGSQSAANLGESAANGQLAYVLYTSGSTGTPKGVMISHGGMLNYLQWCIGAYELSAGWGAPVHSPVSFDLTVTSLWGPLLSGGAVELVRGEGAAGLEGLGKALGKRRDYSLVKLTPAHLEALGEGTPEAGVRTLVVGGEMLRAESLGEWRRKGTRIVNEYGPTETVVGCCVYTVGEGDAAQGGVPIGRPIANTRLYVLDGRWNAVPIGSEGELYIGGAGVARGYLGRPEWTAERFVPDPFGGTPGARMYRTGDAVRYREDGNLEYLGRLDRQVKIRGFRLELEEIRCHLNRFAGIRDSVVVLRERSSGRTGLVAYYVSRRPIDPAELRAFLEQYIAADIVPNIFHCIAKLPLTLNGKVDYKALPEGDDSAAQPQFRDLGPRGAVEEAVAEIWREVLNLPRVGIHDNFFDLGGHSLPAMQISSRLGAVFGRELPVRLAFDFPTIAAIGAHLETLISDARAAGREAPAPGPAPWSGDSSPLSFAQERLWFLDRLTPNSAGYNIVGAVRLRGQLQTPLLLEAFERLIERHDALRTSFRMSGGQPTQLVQDSVSFRLLFADCSGLGEGQRELAAQSGAAAESRRPFDLGCAPLIRSAVFRIGPHDHIVSMTIHHIVCDGWSIGVLLHELGELYSAAADRRPAKLPALPLRYVDYARWQRQRFSTEALSSDLSFWKRELSTTPHLIEFPTDHRRPVLATGRGASREFSISSARLDQLKAAARQEGVTLFMLLVTAFQALLYRYSGQEEFTVGIPVAGRHHAECEPIVGLFANTLVLCARFGRSPTFREALERTREFVLGAYAHQEIPFEKLVLELNPERRIGANPLFQVMFALDNSPQVRLDLPGLKLSGVEIDSGSAKFDLTLAMREATDGLRGAFNYSLDLWEASTIDRMASHFEALLGGFIEAPNRTIAAFPLTGETERRQMAVWNDTGDGICEPALLHRLFQQQAARSPDAIAVRAADATLTYRDLDAKSAQLANCLRRAGVSPERRVGICLERSSRLLVALLATLKAGGAYVPLDPAYPSERLEFMLKDSEAVAIITSQQLAARLPDSQAAVFDVDAAELTPAAASSFDESPADASSAAYVIYTSGSTGRPKGVVIEHRSAVAFLRWALGLFAHDLERTLASTSICFDLSVFELFAPLLCGGCVVIVENALSLIEMAESGITLLNTVPSAMTELLRVNALPPSVRTVNLAGEPLTETLARQIRGSSKVCRIFNLYGPTEYTTYATASRVDERGAPNIGRPVANTQVYVLDEYYNLLPIGLIGEAYLAGDGLARGYLDNPAATASAFIPNPFSPTPGARMYRTGDRVRWHPGGWLEYLGRNDNQVKVRGFRIELGEIETALRRHPEVRDAVVLAPVDDQGRRLLEAHVVLEPPEPSVVELRNWVKNRLPEHMCPLRFAVHDALPLTPNGKINRLALSSSKAAYLDANAEFTAPRSDLEREIARIWAGALGRETIGVFDNFFDLGGHSLLLAQVAHELKQALQRDVSLIAMFQYPTIGALVQHLNDGKPPAQHGGERAAVRKKLAGAAARAARRSL
jgi:amino acid adenylation domain-containing protein